MFCFALQNRSFHFWLLLCSAYCQRRHRQMLLGLEGAKQTDTELQSNAMLILIPALAFYVLM